MEVKGSADVRAADRNIAALASDGLYRTAHHLAVAQGQAVPGRDPQEVVAAHLRWLEALRRVGVVERVAEGLWKVPGDLPEQGRQYDAQRLGGVAVELKSHLPIERQARVIGATRPTGMQCSLDGAHFRGELSGRRSRAAAMCGIRLSVKSKTVEGDSNRLNARRAQPAILCRHQR